MKRQFSSFVFAVIIFAIVLQFVLPFIYPIVGDDAWIHLNWIEQFPKLFYNGVCYPRWLPDGFWGFGSPAFYFYPPLTYWAASIIGYSGLSPVGIFRMLELTGTILSCFTCFLYLRSLRIEKTPSIFGAMIYGIFPYRIIDLYLRNAIGEHLSFIFLPLILYGIEIVLKVSAADKRTKDFAILISAIGWSGILLLNVPAAIVMIYVVPLYCMFRAWQVKNYKIFLFPALGAVIGSMIAAIYIIPAMMYSNAIKLSNLWETQRSFWNISEVLLGIFQGDHRYFSIGLAATIVLGCWLMIMSFLTKLKKDRGAEDRIFIFFAIIPIIFQIPFVFPSLSGLLPLLKYVQFGFRWNLILVLSAAYFTARWYNNDKQYFRLFILSSAIISIGLSGGYLISSFNLHWKYNPTTEHMDAPEYLPLSTNANYVLAKMLLKKHASDPAVQIENDSTLIHVISSSPDTIKFTLNSSTASKKVVFHRASFPTWKLSDISGKIVEQGSDSLGRITAIVPGVAQTYILMLEAGKPEKIASIISLAGLILLGAILFITIFSRNSKAS